MEVIKENEYICLKENNVIIETYSFTEEINFRKLVEYLLSLNLSKKVTLFNNLKDLTNDEENLINLICRIVDAYNENVENLDKFKQSYEKTN